MILNRHANAWILIVTRYKILITLQNKWIFRDILLIQNCCKTIIFQSSGTFIKSAINNYQRIKGEYYSRWKCQRIKKYIILLTAGDDKMVSWFAPGIWNIIIKILQYDNWKFMNIKMWWYWTRCIFMLCYIYSIDEKLNSRIRTFSIAGFHKRKLRFATKDIEFWFSSMHLKSFLPKF